MKLLLKATPTLAALHSPTPRPPFPPIQHRTFQGFDISIETDKGQVRHWNDPLTGTAGTTTMKYPYGYIRGSIGSDGDHVDCFLGPNEEATHAFIVKQVHPDKRHHDEEKIMLGFDDEADAKWAYLEHYSDARFFGGIAAMPMPEFKRKVLKTAEEPGKVQKSAQGTSDLRQAHDEHLDHYRQGKRDGSIDGSREEYLDHVGQQWHDKKASSPYDKQLRIIEQARALAEQSLDEQVKNIKDGQEPQAEELAHVQEEITRLAATIQSKHKKGADVQGLILDYRGLLRRRRELSQSLNIADELIDRGLTHTWPDPEKEANPWV